MRGSNSPAGSIVFGPWHLDHISTEWVGYYNTRRAHTVREHLPSIRKVPEKVIKVDRDQIVVQPYVGGLVKSFEQRAA